MRGVPQAALTKDELFVLRERRSSICCKVAACSFESFNGMSLHLSLTWALRCHECLGRL